MDERNTLEYELAIVEILPMMLIKLALILLNIFRYVNEIGREIL